MKKKLVPWYIRFYHFARNNGAEPSDNENSFEALLCQGISPCSQVNGPGLEASRVKGLDSLLFEHEGISIAQMLDDLNGFLAWTNWSFNFIDSSRTMATFSDGHIGWVPETACPNDEVLLIQGAPFAFIVRQKFNGCYEIVGDAYIDGIEDGEAWEERKGDTKTISLE